MDKYSIHKPPSKYTTPLWVISLFVTLTEAVLGAAVTQTEGFVQAALTIFVLIFPLFIATAFFYILWNRPHHLFSPNEYGNKVSITEYVGALQKSLSGEEAHLLEDIEQTIKDALKSDDIQKRFIEHDNIANSNSNAANDDIVKKMEESSRKKISRALDYAIDQTIEHVKESNFITFDTSPLLPNSGREHSIPYKRFKTIDDLLDYIWFNMQLVIPPYSYGEAWMLRNIDTGEVLRDINRKIENGIDYKDNRTLKQVGILPGARLEVVKYLSPIHDS